MDFSGADLRSADLRSANLRSADLSGANLRSADLRSADLSGADLPSGHHYAQISFDGHGECGRKLTIFKTPNSSTYACGCFVGTEQGLRDYIEAGDSKHVESRLYALTCLMGALEISERRKAI